jgi:hypothetical protein
MVFVAPGGGPGRGVRSTVFRFEKFIRRVCNFMVGCKGLAVQIRLCKQTDNGLCALKNGRWAGP